jgi:hypothetical protein
MLKSRIYSKQLIMSIICFNKETINRKKLKFEKVFAETFLSGRKKNLKKTRIVEMIKIIR